MFIETVPNRTSPPAILLRESYRDEAGKAQKRTLANLSKLPASLIAGLKGLLKGGGAIPTAPGAASEEGLRIERSLPHGHVAPGLGMLRKIKLDRLLLSTAKDEHSRRCCDLAIGLIVDRLLASRSKLGFVRAVNSQTTSSSLGEVLSLGAVAEREVYAALDWLLEQQPRVESALARRHLKNGTLVLYDVSSSYLEGRKCPLAQHGYSRDHRPDRLQIVYGLLCTREGLPVAVEVFDGDTADPTALAAQIKKLRQRFALERVVLVGDRGMLTSARIREEVEPAGLDWISCLRSDAIQKLASDDGPLQLSLFDERDLAEIAAPEQFPGERLIVCRNPLLAQERARKREALLTATERGLARIAARVRAKRNPLRGAAEIGRAVGVVVGKHKVAKHFEIEIGEAQLIYRRKSDGIAREARLDGVYVVRPSVAAAALDADETVQAYKDLARVDIDQTWRLSRIKGWRVWGNARKQGAAEWQGCRAGGFEFGDCRRVRGDEFVEGPQHFDRAAAQAPFLNPVIDRAWGRADFGGEFVDRPFVRATVRDGPRGPSLGLDQSRADQNASDHRAVEADV